jgi:hypothetical protein
LQIENTLDHDELCRQVKRKFNEEGGLSNNLLLSQECMDTFATLEAGKLELTPQVVRQTMASLENKMAALPSAYHLALETTHNFADNVYTRTVFMKAGSLITGKIHKLDHVVVIQQGSATVISEEFGKKLIHAPMVFVSRPVVKRMLFIHEDMIWTTVHQNPTNTRDLEELERLLILPDYESLPGAE